MKKTTGHFKQFIFTIAFLITLTTIGNAAPGGLDPTFSGDGKLIDFFSGYGNDYLTGLALQTDGKIVAVGQVDSGFSLACGVSRFNADGSLDASFGTAGKTILSRISGDFDYACQAAAIQTDGKIVAVGYKYDPNTNNGDFVIYRLNTDGSPDASFGNLGEVSVSVSSVTEIGTSVALQSDGKIVSAGYTRSGSIGSPVTTAVIMRLNTNGSPDATFGTNGVVIYNPGAVFNPTIEAVAIQTDGKITAGGSITESSQLQFLVLRYNTDGSPDTSFGTGGKATAFPGSVMRDMALQSDGKIVAAGGTVGQGSNFALARFDQNGSLDASFGSAGTVNVSFGFTDIANSVAVQSDGKIVAAGSTFNSPGYTFDMLRLNANGTPDNSFGTAGKVSLASANRTNGDGDPGADVFIQPDGKIVSANSLTSGNDFDFVALRFDSGGTLDTTFDTDGYAYADIGTKTNIFNAVAVQTDGKIIAAGYINNGSNTDFAVARYNANGSPDTSFGTAGKVVTPILTANSSDFANAVAVQPDGKIVVGGVSNSSFAVVRYNADGSLDTSFDSDGKATISETTFDGAKSVLVQTDGKIVIAGPATGGANADFFAARFNPNGSLDTSFGGTGRIRTPVLSSDDYANAAALQADGKIVVAGYTDAGSFNYDFAVVRYNADGSLDTSFDTDGKATIPILSGEDQANAVALQTDGKIVLAGYAINGASNEEFALARFNANGSLDTSFDTDGKLTTQLSDNESVANSVAVQTDGKIIAAGYIFSSSFEYDFALARYNPNGSLDASYGTSGKSVFNFGATGEEEMIRGISLDSSGRTVAVGYTGGLMAIARILGDGDVQPAGRTPFDFDGDGRADLSVFRPNADPAFSDFQIRKSSDNNLLGYSWGLPNDKLAPADYDGDGITDVAVWRETEGNFYILNSATSTLRLENFGLPGDNLTVGDWDGDDKADLSVYRNGTQSNFYYRGSLNNLNGNITYVPWGTAGDKPVRGDFDGDGKQDAAVFRPSNNTWYIRNSANGSIRYDSWGIATDKFVCADYDGDAKTDLAVFRNGVWYIKQSSTNTARYENFGLSTDQLTPADYDGDGRIDVAVFRDGIWYLKQSTSGFAAAQFGLTGDQPVPNAYLNQ